MPFISQSNCSGNNIQATSPSFGQIKWPLMKTAKTQPDTVLVPAQDFDTRVAEDKSGFPLPGLVQVVGNVLGQGIDAPAHIDRLARQPDVLRR